MLRGHRSLGGYGYGWSLDNVADWIFAYYAIFPENRPKDEYNNQMSDGEIVNHICRFAEIGHTRMTKEEETYMRISKEHPERKFRGGQVGNHAKVLIADDSIFYVGRQVFEINHDLFKEAIVQQSCVWNLICIVLLLDFSDNMYGAGKIVHPWKILQLRNHLRITQTFIFQNCQNRPS